MRWPRRLAEAMRQRDHDVIWIRQDFPGMADVDVLALAVRESRVCLTFDKDFGQLAANRPVPHDSGVVLLRLPPPASADLAQSIVIILESRSDWVGHFPSSSPAVSECAHSCECRNSSPEAPRVRASFLGLDGIAA